MIRGASIVILCCLSACGCVYKGGKVVDGSNVAIGMTVPGTEWSINLLDYVSGLRVAGDSLTRVTVSNEVNEITRVLGIFESRRRSKMAAEVEPRSSGGRR